MRKINYKRIASAVLGFMIAVSAFAGCGESNRRVYQPESEVESEFDKNGNSIKADDISSGVKMYVTGVEKTISMKESNDNDADNIRTLKVKDEVTVLDDEPAGDFLYVSFEDKIGNVVKGYVKKNYLTSDKNAACERINAFISKKCRLQSEEGKPICEMNKNDAIFIVSQNAGDFWYIYHKNSKFFGYVNRMYISDEKIKEESKAVSVVSTQPSNDSSRYVGSGSTPKVYTTKYVFGVDDALLLRRSPDSSGKNPLGELYNGDTVYDIETVGAYTYCYSPKLRMYGYCTSMYLTSSKPTIKPPINYEKYYAVNLRGGWLTVRSSSSENSTEIGKIYENDVIYITDKSGGKYWKGYIPDLELFGYVNHNYLSSKKSSSSSSSSSSKISSSGKSTSTVSSKKENSKYVGYSDTAPDPSEYVIRYVYNVKNSLGIRKEKSKSDTVVIARANEGEVIYVIENEGDYVYCYHPKSGYYGYAASDKLSEYPPDFTSEDSESEESVFDDSSSEYTFDSSDVTISDDGRTLPPEAESILEDIWYY